MNGNLKLPHFDINLKAVMLFSLWFVAGFCAAQTDIDTGNTPISETEIICYAAQKKWVCAPADQKQQAHNKAMKLAKQYPDDSDESDSMTDNTNDGQVEIKTMDMNNDFSQQVEELPEDPLMKDENLATQENKSNKNVVNEPELSSVQTDNNLIETPDTQSSQLKPEAEAVILSNNDLLKSTDFSVWQNNFPNQWSFQVVGSSNRQHLSQFIVSNNLQQLKHTTVKTEVNGADWWIVLVGLYESRGDALSHRNQLPAQLANQAWVRQIKTIKGTAH